MTKKPVYNERKRLALLNAEPDPEEKPNLRLFFQLSPQIEPMARAMRCSKPTIYNIVGERKYNPKPETIAKFNAYLKEMLNNRVKWGAKAEARSLQ